MGAHTRPGRVEFCSQVEDICKPFFVWHAISPQTPTVLVSKPLNLTSLTLHVLRRFLLNLVFIARLEKWNLGTLGCVSDTIKAIFFMRQESLLFWYGQTIF